MLSLIFRGFKSIFKLVIKRALLKQTINTVLHPVWNLDIPVALLNENWDLHRMIPIQSQEQNLCQKPSLDQIWPNADSVTAIKIDN